MTASINLTVVAIRRDIAHQTKLVALLKKRRLRELGDEQALQISCVPL
jgi:hypothetical protein